ncbi:MAG: Xaa-Pro aminopeptidase [Immundisolibacter sp.]|uniref:Xaa-Pro aminopeptidase n=1 Tax=Immundisolibacter sp. TaxID=1934948 RepID=UPI003EE3E94C
MQQKELAGRRRTLMQQMGDGIAIIPTNPHHLRNRDTEFPFRPDSDFFYLTGFAEPEAVAILIPGRPQGEFIVFCRERDPTKETWTGRRAGPEGVMERFGADDAFPIADLDDIMPGLLENRAKVFYSLGADSEFDQRVLGWVNGLRAKVRAGVHVPSEFVDLGHLLHDMRLFKSAAELKVMRRAADISAAAHVRAMRACRPGKMEYEIEAELRHEFIRNGARLPAYEPIVGGGANGCILHYVDNNAVLNDGELLLIDAGCEIDCYAADITRTFPINGRFSPEQTALYELVLDAQLAAIDKVRPGNHWNEPHEAAVWVLTAGLLRLRILKGELTDLIEQGAYRSVYMHRTGHWLGMDVHDVGEYKLGDAWRVFEPGMVTTVEPGLYIAAGTPGVAKKWWNIGIRIEDNVVVTRRGHEVTTGGVPKSVVQIEALMASA